MSSNQTKKRKTTDNKPITIDHNNGEQSSKKLKSESFLSKLKKAKKLGKDGSISKSPQESPVKGVQPKKVKVPQIELRENQPSSDTIATLNDVKIGKFVDAVIYKISRTVIRVTLGPGVHGIIYNTDTKDSHDKGNPFEGYKKEQKVRAKVIGFKEMENYKDNLAITGQGKQPKKTTYAILTLRPSLLSLPEYDIGNPPLALENVKEGQKLHGIIDEVTVDALWISFSFLLRGRCFILEASNDIDTLRNLQEKFIPGNGINCIVSHINKEHRSLDVSVKAYYENLPSFEPGSIIPVRTLYLKKRSWVAQIAAHKQAFITPSCIDDVYTDDITSKLEPMQIMNAKILGEVDNIMYLSIRPSDIGDMDSSATSSSHYQQVISSVDQISIGDLVWGFVAGYKRSSKSVKIELGWNLTGLVPHDQLRDYKVSPAEISELFPLNKLVQARVIELEPSIVLTLKPSEVKDLKSIGDFKPRQLVTGRVASISNKHGIYIKLMHSSVIGLCRKRDISDDGLHGRPLDELYQVGDRVKALILSVDEDNNKMGLCLKESAVMKAQENPSNQEQEEEDSEEEEEVKRKLIKQKLIEKQKLITPNKQEEDEEEEEPIDVIMGNTTNTQVGNITENLGISVGFSWGNEKEEDEVPEELEEEAEEDLTEDQVGSDKKKSKSAKKKEKKKKQQEIIEKEQARVDQKLPETASEYEKLLLSSPNSSYIWIKYMAFHISLTEIDKARQVARRALKTINLRESAEKMNVWVAWLNLENMFGTPESLTSVFQEAVMYNDPKTIHLKLADIYERSDHTDQAEQLYKTMSRKFKESSKVWKNYAMFLVKNNKIDQFRTIMTYALKSLPKRKHLKIISKFGQIEFKHGSPERGRTIFEGIVSNYPKRADLWNIYLDMEIRNGDKEKIRHLYERVVSLKQSSKKMKYFFKRFLNWEKENGDEDSINKVKQLAREYVEKST